jgi:integrase
MMSEIKGVYRRCGCLDPATGRRWGTKCPRLVVPTHGSWYFAVQVTDGMGRRRRDRRGGFATADAAEQARDAALVAGRRGSAEVLTVRDWLYEWLRSLPGTVRPSTVDAYRSHVVQYLSPGIGRFVLDTLTVGDVQRLFDGLRLRHNRYREPLTAATLQRVWATLRRALNVAVREGLLAANPARAVRLAVPGRVRPMMWSPTRVAAWRESGWRPAVAVWPPTTVARFLAGVRDDPLNALWWLAALTGLRRGELLGLRWTDLDLESATLTVSRQRVEVSGGVRESEPKTAAGHRTLSLDETTTAVLKRHRVSPWSSAAAEGLVFCWPDGRAVRPDWVTHRFRRLVDDQGLPPVRLHDLRHGAATMALAAGADVRTVQEMLGHTSYAFTADTYTCVTSQRLRDLADATARLVLRELRKHGAT